MIRGLYRVHGADGLPDDVRVDDGGIEMPLEEKLYRARGYLPRVEDLLWQEDYFAPRASADDLKNARESKEKAAREEARRDFLDRFRKN